MYGISESLQGSQRLLGPSVGAGRREEVWELSLCRQKLWDLRDLRDPAEGRSGLLRPSKQAPLGGHH